MSSTISFIKTDGTRNVDGSVATQSTARFDASRQPRFSFALEICAAVARVVSDGEAAVGTPDVICNIVTCTTVVAIIKAGLCTGSELSVSIEAGNCLR